jgi:hypothetical protein
MAGDRPDGRRNEATRSRDANGRGRYVSTGHLPSPREIQLAVDEAYRMYRSEDGGATSQTYPALARVPGHLFGICVAGIGGGIYRVGDAGHEFTLMRPEPVRVQAARLGAVPRGGTHLLARPGYIGRWPRGGTDLASKMSMSRAARSTAPARCSR